MENIKDYDDEGMQNKKSSEFRYSMWFLVFIFEIDCICNIQWACVNYIRTFYYVNIGGVYVLMTSVYVVEFVFEYSVFHARAMPYTALLFLFLFSAKLSDDAHICFIAMLYIQIYTLTIYLVVMFFLLWLFFIQNFMPW